DFDEDHQEMMTDYTDDLKSTKLDQQENEEDGDEEEMDGLFMNRDNYDEKTDLEEDKQTFRTTKLDPKENLPYDYGRIYQFPSFRTLIKQIESEQEYNQHKQDHAQELAHLLFVKGLLPHEQCLSVLNIVLNRTNDSEIIVKSKERLIFHVGFHHFSNSPIYSQHSN
ncbi:unnamed protein product, partial [Rotaria sp. Silwood1]